MPIRLTTGEVLPEQPPMYLIDQLRSHRAKMIDYLQLKLEQEDWHGVADAAMDLREIDAKIEVLKQK